MTEHSAELVALPCCNYIEAVYDHDPEGPCEGTMEPGWPEYVCDTCRARCGAQAHPLHARPATPDEEPCLHWGHRDPSRWGICTGVSS